MSRAAANGALGGSDGTNNGGGVVAECALTALHTEMVVYVIRHRAQQVALSQAKALSERAEALLAGRIDEEDDDDFLDEDSIDDDCDDGQDSMSGAAAAITRSGGGGVGGVADNGGSANVEYVLETMGVHAGLRITERLLFREPLVRYTPLEVTRFVGNQLWRAIFGKKVDKMKHLDNIYFSLVESQFAWHRCSMAAAAATSSSSSAGTAAVGNQQGGGHQNAFLSVAPGFSADGTVMDLEAARREASAQLENAQRQLPTPKDVLLYLQGVIVGAVDTLLGPGSQAIVGSQIVSGADVQFILDFRQCSRL